MVTLDQHVDLPSEREGEDLDRARFPAARRIVGLFELHAHLPPRRAPLGSAQPLRRLVTLPRK